MKIQINNLGPIYKFDFDLSKDLNVIFGQNNIGKSYAITAVYLIIKNLISDDFKRSASQIQFLLVRGSQVKNRNSDFAKSNFMDLEKGGNEINNRLKDKKEIEVTNELKKYFTSIISNQLIGNLEKSFNNSFSSIDGLNNKLSTKRFEIIITFNTFQFSIIIHNNKLTIANLTFNHKIFIKKASKSNKPLSSNGKLTLYFNAKAKANNVSSLLYSSLLEYYVQFDNEVSEIINNIYFLPASRSGLYQALSTFNAVIAELSKSRTFLSNKLELPNISEPVLDYFLYLANININKPNKKFQSIIKYLENDILNGTVLFNDDSKKIVFTPSLVEMELDLSFTSSMISEIAPIVAFFKYIIGENENRREKYYYNDIGYITFSGSSRRRGATNLIFIEEPEAHLHPKVQVQLMQLFVELAKYDVKIVMTSHSNYMFNKLSNLILDSKIKPEKVGSYLMKNTQTGSVNDAVSMMASEEGMMDNNFADIAEELYEERISIYEKINKTNAN